MNSYYIRHSHTRFHYRVFGSGKKLVFAFHGYGRDSYTFSFLEKSLGRDYTIIAIDLPFHGLTEWDKELTFHPEYLVQVIQEIRKERDALHDHFVLLGFSMGGRIALHLAQIMHRHVERLSLVAPDGLRINFWYWLGTHTWPGHKLLHYTVEHPSWFIKLLNFAQRTGLMTKSLAGFVHYYFDDKEQRLTLYRRWATMRKFMPASKKLRRHIMRDKIKVCMLFGQYDNVILHSPATAFAKGLEEHVKVNVINAGHNLLQPAHTKDIIKLFID